MEIGESIELYDLSTGEVLADTVIYGADPSKWVESSESSNIYGEHPNEQEIARWIESQIEAIVNSSID